MGIILSLLLALSLNQAEVENARQAQEANNTIDEQQIRIDMLSQRVKRLEKEKQTLIHSKKEVKTIKVSNENNDNNNKGYESYTVTWYTSGYESTGKTSGDSDYGITASGEKVKEGRTLACPKSLEFGTKVYIKELDHTYTCTDRGGAIKSGRLDIYIDSLKQALKNGKQKYNVKIIKEGA
ncbi:3D domain-containing protein [Paenibacillus sp. Marseille-Q4541]|uniref:3D domain-containing protein n=1 Tax=Paenibacillus sp. Marseille-Q4541 TaxID=2831522 RepID=UPI001BA4F82B|nr:3D domain-containing protein [Paenibacillus sp. Marseille-Q4541]